MAGAADALELSDEYEHVTLIYAEADGLSVTVDIGGPVVGATHGQVIGSPDKMGARSASKAVASYRRYRSACLGQPVSRPIEGPL